MSQDQPYRSLSYWLSTVPGELSPGDPLPGDQDVDVAIAGAGFTGLWTAYYLAQASPGLRIAVCEREIAGFGASGRNGGWCSALFPASLAKLERMAGRDAAVAMYRAMQETVDEVGRVTAAEGIDCHWAKGGTVQLARSPAQLERAREEVAEYRAFGFGQADLRLLNRAEAAERVAASGVLGATYTPHCAAIHPARLARGLAAAVRQHGVRLYEQTPVTEIAPGRMRTPSGTVRAEYVIRATEGYTPLLPGLHRAIAPVYSLMIATASLPDSSWAEIGLARPAHVRRRPAPHHLRPAHRGWAAGLRRPGCAVPLRLHYPAGVRPGARGVRRPAAVAGRAVPGTGRCPGHPHLGRPARRAPRLVRDRPDWTANRPGAGPAATWGMGCRPPTSPAAPWPTWCWRRLMDLPGCPGSAILAGLGARAAALAGRQRRAHAMGCADRWENRTGHQSRLAGFAGRFLGD